MADPITLGTSIAQLEFDLQSLASFLGRTKLHPENSAEQLSYTAKRLGELQAEARNLEVEARQLARST